MSRPSFLERHIAQLTSPAGEPRPPCPACGNPRPVLIGARDGPFGRLPRYCCTHCNRGFTRLTGTPLARLKLDREVFARVLALLDKPLAIRAAAANVGIKEVTLARIVRELRAWLLELDPTGAEQARVTLGGHIVSPLGRPSRPKEASDAVLTRAIEGTVQSLRSRRGTPVPAQCPHCESTHVRLRHGASSSAPLPSYCCVTCQRSFTRLTGTPLARSRWPEKQRQFVRYLGVPLQLTEVADRLGVDYGTVRDWRHRYSELVSQIDPSGALAERIRIAPALTAQPCGNCGHVDALAWDDERWHCAGCGRILGKPLTTGE